MKAFLLLKASVGGTTWLSKGGILDLKEKGRLWVAFTAIAGTAIGGAAFLWILILNYRGLMQSGLAIGHQELLLFSAMLASWVFVFFIGIPVAMSILNFSKDTRLLASLPLRDRDIVASKGLRLYLYLLPIHLIIYLPAVVITALNTDVNTVFIVAAVLQPLMGVCVPLGLAVVFVGLLTKLVNVSRWETAIEVIGMAFGVVAAFGVQLLVVRTAAVDVSVGLGGGMTEGDASGPLSPSGMAPFFAGMLECVPPAAWSARSLVRPQLFCRRRPSADRFGISIRRVYRPCALHRPTELSFRPEQEGRDTAERICGRESR